MNPDTIPLIPGLITSAALTLTLVILAWKDHRA